MFFKNNDLTKYSADKYRFYRTFSTSMGAFPEPPGVGWSLLRLSESATDSACWTVAIWVKRK